MPNGFDLDIRSICKEGGHKGLCRILFMTFEKVKSDFRPDRLPPNIGGPTLHEIKPLYMKEDPSQINPTLAK